MDERAQRIVDIAIDVAERDGFAAVRLRDIAAQANVALGTVYRRFASKEDILVAALEREFGRLQKRLAKKVPKGTDPLVRVRNLFLAATEGFCRRPNFARAVLRAVASGDPDTTDKVARFHSVMTNTVVCALCGFALDDVDREMDDEYQEYLNLAFILQQVWFAALVGWAGGLHPKKEITEQVETAAAMMLKGMNTP